MFCDQLNLWELYWNLTCRLPALLGTSAHPLPVLLRLVLFSWASWSPLVWPVLALFCLISKPIVLRHDLYVRPRPQVNSYRNNMWTPRRGGEKTGEFLSVPLCVVDFVAAELHWMCYPDVPEQGEQRGGRKCKEEMENITQGREDILSFLKQAQLIGLAG